MLDAALEPLRYSQLNPSDYGMWLEKGYDPAELERYLSAVKLSLSSDSIVMDLRVGDGKNGMRWVGDQVKGHLQVFSLGRLGNKPDDGCH